MFTLVSKDKHVLISRAMFIIDNFEPNSNYELDVIIRRSRSHPGCWAMSARLIFPHMHYKRTVRQAQLYGPGTEQLQIPISKKHFNITRRMPSLLNDGQTTMTDFFHLNNQVSKKGALCA